MSNRMNLYLIKINEKQFWLTSTGRFLFLFAHPQRNNDLKDIHAEPGLMIGVKSRTRVEALQQFKILLEMPSFDLICSCLSSSKPCNGTLEELMTLPSSDLSIFSSLFSLTSPLSTLFSKQDKKRFSLLPYLEPFMNTIVNIINQ